MYQFCLFRGMTHPVPVIIPLLGEYYVCGLHPTPTFQLEGSCAAVPCIHVPFGGSSGLSEGKTNTPSVCLVVRALAGESAPSTTVHHRPPRVFRSGPASRWGCPGGTAGA